MGKSLINLGNFCCYDKLNIMFKNLLTLFTIIICINSSFSQKFLSNTKYQVEAGTFLSTNGTTPFWLRSNQYGIVPLSSPFLTIRGTAHKEYDSTKNENQKLKKFGYGFGLGSVVNVGKQSGFLLPEAYMKLRYGAFEFYGGRRKEIVGLVDTTLTSGSYIWSGNALPIPKIQISIPTYTSIIGHGLISIKGGYAHGWFDNGLVQNFYLHQKWFYGRLGKSNWKVRFYAGFNHQVQWGGKPKVPFIENQTGRLINKYPSGLATYLKVLSGISLNTIQNTPDIPTNEAWNRAGNHLGSLDIGTEINCNKVTILMYRQNIYEDGSLFYLNNISDGLFGFSVYPKNAKNYNLKFLFEYLSTRSQGGEAGGGEQIISQLRGRDNYFNNSLYFDGWTYSKKVIGTPLMTPLPELKSGLISIEDIKKVSESFIANNRLQAFNLGLVGTASKTNFYFKWSHSKNYGFFATPLIKNPIQNSFIFSISKKINYLTYKIGLSGDFGQLFNDNLGLNINILKSW